MGDVTLSNFNCSVLTDSDDYDVCIGNDGGATVVENASFRSADYCTYGTAGFNFFFDNASFFDCSKIFFQGNAVLNISDSLIQNSSLLGNDNIFTIFSLDNSVINNSFINPGSYSNYCFNLFVLNNSFINSSISHTGAYFYGSYEIKDNNFSDIYDKNAIVIPDGQQGTVFGNVFNNVGNTTYSPGYLASFYPIKVNGTVFDDCVLIVSNSGGDFLAVSEDDTVVSDNDWFSADIDLRAWAYDDSNKLVNSVCNYDGDNTNITVFLQEDYPLTCDALVGIYGGTCYYAMEVDAVKSAGAGNDFVFNETFLNDTAGASGITYPPYIKYNDSAVTNYNFTAINNNDGTMSIYDNIFNSSGNFLPMNLSGGGDDQVYQNYFFDTAVPLVTNSEYLCVGGVGNFYEEGTVPASGDCGQYNITGLSVAGRTVSITATDQSSSILGINYDFFTSRDYNAWVWAVNDTTPLFSKDLSASTGDYRVKIVPFVWWNGVRFNATNEVSTVFNIPPFSSGSGGSSSGSGEAPVVCFYPKVWNGSGCVENVSGTLNVTMIDEVPQKVILNIDFDGLRNYYNQKDDSLISTKIITSTISGGKKVAVSPKSISVYLFDTSINQTIEIITPIEESDGVFSFSKSTLDLNLGKYIVKIVVNYEGELFYEEGVFEVTDDFLILGNLPFWKNIYILLIVGLIAVVIFAILLSTIFLGDKKRK
jgi:hypothetical protein